MDGEEPLTNQQTKIAIDWSLINDWYLKVDAVLYCLKNGGSVDTAIGILEPMKTQLMERRGI